MKRVRALLFFFLVVVFVFPASAHAQDCCHLVDSAIAHRYLVGGLAERRFTYAELWRALEPYLGGSNVRVAEVGRSLHGLPIRAVTFGTGATTVLLWSQMHGDESTATMALADIIRFFATGGNDPRRALVHQRLTITMVPMLNPDGAERFQRYDAAGVDINRDARRLATPEARALKTLRDSIRPEFGFNLHDQGARTTAGAGGRQVAIALLAPASDSARTWTPVRLRARQLAAALAAAIGEAWPGRVAKYDDTFNPRAFGDLMQQWGTSTVLIESGALPNDPEKQVLRAVNVRAILMALQAIATRSYESAPLPPYDSLPFNSPVPNDLLLVGGQVVVPGSEPLPLDLALTYDDPVAETGLTLAEIGDLDDAVALDTVDASGLYLHLVTASTLDPRDWWLVRGQRIAVALRRGASAESAIVMHFPR